MSAPETIAHYRITAKLGEGGMGAVYRATDTRLNRDVAIKVLPDAFADDPDRLARFTREAQLLASLNHPNIATIHGVEDRAIVMELVEGDDLSAFTARGPVADALSIARQIAEALEYAHERGVIHRDLKPANIKLTPEGTVKILDFGLAKALSAEPAAASSNLTVSPTLTMRATVAGVILGTAAYMSPEQARGMPADKRSDIWSFGVVLFEMLTGRMAFPGDTISDVLASVLKTEPDWSALPADTHPAIRRLLRRCLERDRKRRLPDIGVARLEIEEALNTPAAPPPSAVNVRSGPQWWALPLALVALAGIAIGVVHFRETPPASPALRFDVREPENSNFANTGLAVSPDGTQIAFIAALRGGDPVVWVHSLQSNTSRMVPGTEGAAYLPFWSPDGRYIGFAVGATLKKVLAAGAPPQTLCQIGSAIIGGSWNPDGVIIFGPPSGGLYRISQGGGQPSRLTTSDEADGDLGHIRPWFLPDGRHYLMYMRRFRPEEGGIYLGSLDSTEHRRLVLSQQAGVYVPPGPSQRHGTLLFLHDGVLMGLPLDSAYQAAGDTYPIAEQVGAALAMGYFSASANGVLAFRSGSSDGPHLTWFDRKGQRIGPSLEVPISNQSLSLSPDGTRAVYDQFSVNGKQLWIWNVVHNTRSRLSFDVAVEESAVWSPNGSTVALHSSHGSPASSIVTRDVSGSGTSKQLLQSSSLVYPAAWSPDGRYLAYSLRVDANRDELWLLSLADLKPAPFVQGAFNVRTAAFSPDSRWLAYSSFETGTYQIYVQSIPQGAGKFQVSSTGGVQPRWSHDGKEIFFIGVNGHLMSIAVRTSPKFEIVGIPQDLFDPEMTTRGLTDIYPHYDVAPDGRFLVKSSSSNSGAAAVPITVIVNWPATVKR